MGIDRFRETWDRYWFGPVATHSLSLVRLYFGVTVFLYTTGFWGLYRLDRLDMDFPRRPMFELGEMFDAVRMPYPGLGWLPVPSPWVYERLEEALLLLSVMMVLGLLTRWVVPATALIFGYLFLVTQWSYHHHSFLMLLVLTILSFSRCGDHYSVDALLRDPRDEPVSSALPLRLIQGLVVILYLFSGASKIQGGWLTGDVVRLLDEGGRLHGVLVQPAIDLLGYRWISILTVEAELFVGVALLFPRFRRAAIFVGILLHLGIDAMLNVGTFSYQMMALYVAFIYPAAGATVAVYDDRCRHCASWPRRMQALDWLDRVSWVGARNRIVRSTLPRDIRPDAGGLTVVRPNGSVEQGFAAWRHLFNSYPATFVPSVVLYLPGVRRLGERAHAALVRRHRAVVATPTTDGSGTWQTSLERARRTLGGRP